MWNDDIVKVNIYRYIISYGIYMDSKIEFCIKIFFFDCNWFYFDIFCVKRYFIFMVYDIQDFLEYMSQEIFVMIDFVCYKFILIVG